MIASEITLFAKFSGPLTKRISLEADGSIRSDGSACLMARGSACRIHLTAASDLGTLISREAAARWRVEREAAAQQETEAT